MSKSTNEIFAANKHLKSLVNLIPNQAHMRLDICNDFILPANWSFHNRSNTNYHLAFVKSGSGRYILDGKGVEMEPGRLYLFAKHCLHSRELDTEDLPRMSLIRFSLLSNGEQLPFRHAFDGHAFSYVTPRPKTFLNLFNRLFSYYNEKGVSYDMLCQITLSQIIYEMYRDVSNSESTVRMDPRLRRAHKHINDHYNEKITLESLVKLSGLSRNYFLKLFKDSYGMTPKQIQIHLRTEQAIQYLMETEMRISEIAERLGYKDQFCFSRQFNEVMGSSPSSFRTQYYQDL